ncbi:hypothetical protein D9M68_820460 [compost metagenome]
MIARGGETGAGSGQPGDIVGEDIARASQVLLLPFGGGVDGYRFVGHPVGAEVLGDVDLMRGASLDADRGAIEIRDGADTQ